MFQWPLEEVPVAEDPGRKWYNKLFSVVPPKGQETATQEPLPPLFGSAVSVHTDQDTAKTVEMTVESPVKADTVAVVVEKQEESKAEAAEKPKLPEWKPV